MVNIIYISILLSVCGQWAYCSRDKLEYELNLLGDNNFERIYTDASDPAVTIFKPINDAEIRVVKCGDETLWTRSGKKHLLLVRLFKVGDENNFISLFYRDGKKYIGETIVKNGNHWKKTGSYRVHNPQDLLDDPIVQSRSTFYVDAEDSGAAAAGPEEEEPVELDLGGDLEEIAKLKRFNALGIPTVEYRPYVDKVVDLVTHRFQTIWKRQDSKGPLRQILYYDKTGFVPLLHISTGNELFDDDDSYYERVKDQWLPVKMDQFFTRLNYAVTDAVDPQFDQPLDEYGGELPDGMDKFGNNLRNKNTWSEYRFSSPPSTPSGQDSFSLATSGTDSSLGSLKSAPEQSSLYAKHLPYQQSEPSIVPISSSPLSFYRTRGPYMVSNSSVDRSGRQIPEENEKQSVGSQPESEPSSMTSEYEMLFHSDAPRSLVSEPEMISKSSLS